MKKRFVASINCIDGRIQLPVIEYLKNKYNVDYVDIITEPGPNKILAEGSDRTTIEALKKRVKISVMKHGSQIITISGHHDCAGNTEEQNIQVKQIISAIGVVKSWNFEAKVIGLWIDDHWHVCEIK